jgi:hypothetical protein
MVMLWECQEKRKMREASMRRTKIGGYRMDCHRRAEESMARRPKMRKRRVGLGSGLRQTSGIKKAGSLTRLS